MIIRRERPEDIERIYPMIARAFAGHPHSDGSEPEIVRRLRKAGALSLALVAEGDNGAIIGHVAFSPAGIADKSDCWFALGPLAVEPSYQRQGIGTALMLGGLELLRDERAAGVVLVGDLAFYGRFGFRAEPSLILNGVPPDHVLALPFEGDVPAGDVAFHRAFFGDI